MTRDRHRRGARRAGRGRGNARGGRARGATTRRCAPARGATASRVALWRSRRPRGVPFPPDDRKGVFRCTNNPRSDSIHIDPHHEATKRRFAPARGRLAAFREKVPSRPRPIHSRAGSRPPPPPLPRGFPLAAAAWRGPRSRRAPSSSPRPSASAAPTPTAPSPRARFSPPTPATPPPRSRRPARASPPGISSPRSRSSRRSSRPTRPRSPRPRSRSRRGWRCTSCAGETGGGGSPPSSRASPSTPKPPPRRRPGGPRRTRRAPPRRVVRRRRRGTHPAALRRRRRRRRGAPPRPRGRRRPEETAAAAAPVPRDAHPRAPRVPRPRPRGRDPRVWVAVRRPRPGALRGVRRQGRRLRRVGTRRRGDERYPRGDDAGSPRGPGVPAGPGIVPAGTAAARESPAAPILMLDARVLPGMEGGPVLDARGDLVGVLAPPLAARFPMTESPGGKAPAFDADGAHVAPLALSARCLREALRDARAARNSSRILSSRAAKMGILARPPARDG